MAGKGFAFPRRFTDEKSMAATQQRNNRELSSFLNSYVVTLDDDGNVVVPASLTVGGQILARGAGTRMTRETTDISVPASTWGASQIIDWNSKTTMNGIDFSDLVNNRFTIPTGYGGTFMTGIQVQFTTAPTGYRLTLAKNGGGYKVIDRADSYTGSAYASIGGTTGLYLADGDYIDYRVEYKSASNIRYGAVWSSCWIVKS